MRESLPALRLLCVALAAVAWMVGCRNTPEPAQPVATEQTGVVPLKSPVLAALPNKAGDDLKLEVLTNARGLKSMRADCQVTLRSPLIRGWEELKLEGRMAVANDSKLKLYLTATEQTMVELTGDGAQYTVDMPGIGNIRYGGTYGSPLILSSRKLSMLPDDIAELFDQNNIFANKVLVVKAYPDSWVIEGLRRVDERMVIAASYRFRREASSAMQNPAKIVAYEKYDPNGDIRCAIALGDYRDVVDKEGGRRGVICALPHHVQISYPREGAVINGRYESTAIDIVLNNVELNPKDLDPARFEVFGAGQRTHPSTTRIIGPNER